MKKINFLVLGLLFFFLVDSAAQLPASSLYMFKINEIGDSTFALSKPVYLSDFNPNGYNNQPSFVSDDELYVTVQMPSDTTQTDIYSLHLKDKVLTQITRTFESEYSPELMPTGDEDSDYFTVVKLFNDREKPQELWKLPLDRKGKGENVFPSIHDVGYYEWISPRRAALFQVGDPHQLVSADTRTTSLVDVAINVGRCIEQIPGGGIAYVDKSRSNSWLLTKLDTRFYQTRLVTATLPGSEDFTILDDGTYIMGNGSKLFKFHPEKDNSWKEIADLNYYGIRNITRLANRNNQLIVVGS